MTYGRLLLSHRARQAVPRVETRCCCQGFAGTKLYQPSIDMCAAATTGGRDPMLAVVDDRARCLLHDHRWQVVENLRQTRDVVVVEFT